MHLLHVEEDDRGNRTLSRSRMESMNGEEKVSELRSRAAEATNRKDPSLFHLLHCGVILDNDDRTLSSYGVKGTSCVHLIPKADPPAVVVAGVEENGGGGDESEELLHFSLSFGLAARNPRFGKFAQRLAKRENLVNLVAAVPGLDRDPVACGFLSKPELMLTLLNPETFKYVRKKHPGLVEAANHLAAAIHEEKHQSSASASASASEDQSNPFAYHLDEMSEDDDYDEMDMSPGHHQANNGQQPAGTNPISAEQLRAALSVAQSAVGVGSSSSSAGPSGSSSSTFTPATITQDQLAAALAGVTAASSTSGGGTAPQPNNNWEKELAKMKEMGISDEALARKALEVMGGDLQAAIELIFSGWDGMDDSTS